MLITDLLLTSEDEDTAIPSYLGEYVGGEAQLGVAGDWQYTDTSSFLGIYHGTSSVLSRSTTKRVDDWAHSIVRPWVW